MKAFLTFVLCSFFTLLCAAQTVETVQKTQMTNTEFNQFIHSIGTQNLKYLTSAAAEGMSDRFTNTDNYFSTSQIRKLLSVIERDSGKWAVARLLYSRVTDPSNFVQLADLFNTSTYRDEFILWCNKSDKF